MLTSIFPHCVKNEVEGCNRFPNVARLFNFDNFFTRIQRVQKR